MDTLKILELNKQLVLDIENLVNMAHNHSRSTDDITDSIVEAIAKRDQALQLQQTGVIVSGGFLNEFIMKTAEDFYLQVTGWESLESVEELDSAKDVVKMIDDFSKEKTRPLIEMLERSIKEINHLKAKYKDTGHCGKYLFECEKLIKETEL